MANNILSKEDDTLKLSDEDSKNLARFCMISAPIYDSVSYMIKELKAIEPYVKEWRELEKPISKIIRRLK
jgi:hypothetical protein